MNKKKEDWFTCPNCGAEVKMDAVICPECGSDDETGWNPDAIQGGTFIQEEEDFDYQETLKREKGKKKISVLKFIIVIILIYLMLIYVFPSPF